MFKKPIKSIGDFVKYINIKKILKSSWQYINNFIESINNY